MSTTQIDSDIGRKGATQDRWQRGDPSPLFKSLLDECKNPRDDDQRKAVYEKFISMMVPQSARDQMDDEQWLGTRAVYHYWMKCHWERLRRLYETPEQKAERMRVAKEREQEARVNIEAGIERQAKRILLDWILPNGKKLRDCTGNECAEASQVVGPWLARIGKKVKSKLVGAVMTEADVQKMFKQAPS